MNKRIVLVILTALTALTVNAQKGTKKSTPITPKLNVEQTTSSGLKIKLTQKGTGIQAQPGLTVAVHYTGTLTNGTKFDSSRDRNQPLKFKLGQGQVIKGWDEGIALLKVGDRATLTVPPSLGYGDRENGKIPANSVLIFDVELVEVIEPVKPFDVKGKDTITTASGLKYIIVEPTKEADAVQAVAGKTVSVHYTGFFTDGRIFDSSHERGTPIHFPLGQHNVIAGWDEGIALMKKGDKFRLIIPPNLAYGEKGAGGGVIPPNATLYFDVELVNVQ